MGKTIVKNAIVVIDAAPFRQWYEAHYALPLGHKRGTKLSEAEEALINKKRSKKTEKKYKERQRRERSSRLWRISSRLAASSPPSPRAPASAAAPTDTFLRERSSSSTSGRSRPRRDVKKHDGREERLCCYAVVNRNKNRKLLK